MTRRPVRHVHFVGIGGAGMSGIAEVLAGLGYSVSGSDLSESDAVQRLRRLGVRVAIGHAAQNAAGADTLVVSSAVSEDNPEVAAGRAARVPIVPRALMLGDLMRLKQGIAIAGTHGKTTTTSLVAAVLAEAGLDPTFVIGGRLNAAGANARLGKGEYLVAESDESDAHFLALQPVIGVVTNIDADHMETYGHDLNRLLEAFTAFMNRLPFFGLAVACVDDANVRTALAAVARPTVTYGTSATADLRALDVRWDGGAMRFRAEQEGFEPLDVSLNLAGAHNVLNALAAIAVGRHVGAPEAAIREALARFQGVGRRFERHGAIQLPDGRRFSLVDDYGHHPVEMTVTIAAARMAFPGRRLLLAFQPHRYTRTRDLFEDFVQVLSSVDALVLADVYPASEAPIVAADGRALARAVRVAGKVEPVFAESVERAVDAVLESVRDGDLVLVMGAGSIGALPGALLAAGTPDPQGRSS